MKSYFNQLQRSLQLAYWNWFYYRNSFPHPDECFEIIKTINDRMMKRNISRVVGEHQITGLIRYCHHSLVTNSAKDALWAAAKESDVTVERTRQILCKYRREYA